MNSTTATEHPFEGLPAPPRRGKYATPPGHRVLHLVIEQETFELLHLCALRSRMKYTAYMARFLKEAFPYSSPQVATAAGDEPTATPCRHHGNAPARSSGP